MTERRFEKILFKIGAYLVRGGKVVLADSGGQAVCIREAAGLKEIGLLLAGADGSCTGKRRFFIGTLIFPPEAFEPRDTTEPRILTAVLAVRGTKFLAFCRDLAAEISAVPEFHVRVLPRLVSKQPDCEKLEVSEEGRRVYASRSR